LFIAVLTLIDRQLPWMTFLAALSLAALLGLGLYKRIEPSLLQFWGALLILGFILYAVSLSYQAQGPTRDARFLTWDKPELSNNPQNQTLNIAYPRILRLEPSGKPGQPLAMYLQPSIPSASPGGINLVPSMTVTLTTAAPPAQTIIPTSTATASQVISYTVIFVPESEGLLFTNEKDAPVVPRVIVRSDQTVDNPSVLYIHRAPLATVPRVVTTTVQVHGLGMTTDTLTTLTFELEDEYDAWWRHFLDLVLGPTTPLLALAAALVGFGWQRWQDEQKIRQGQIEEIREVETLIGQKKLDEAKQKFNSVSAKYRRELGLREALEDTRDQIHLAEMAHIIETLASSNPPLAYQEWRRLEQLKLNQGWAEPDLIAALHKVEVAVSRPRRYDWPKLWPDRIERSDSPAITHWLKESGTDLMFNPFGPDYAEAESRLPELFVEPPGWEEMLASEPMIIIGFEGSGRTASRLLLAHTCQTTRLGTDYRTARVDTFPAHLILFFEGKTDEKATVMWRGLTRALAEATLNFLALNPHTFAQTPFRQQRALARLFKIHRHALGDLNGYLVGAGLEPKIADHLADNIQQAARGTRPPALSDEAELLSILTEARLSPFQQRYLMIEISEQVSALLPPEELAAHLEPLVQIVHPLAARGIYLKLFVSTAVKRHLVPSFSSLLQIRQVELSWDASRLQDLLQRRIEQAGGASLRALFHRPMADPGGLLVAEALKGDGGPRRLIQLGQALLTENIRLIDEERRKPPKRPIPAAKLRWQALENVLTGSITGSVL